MGVIDTRLTTWTAWTPTGTWTANTTYTGKWRRNGDSMDLQIKVALTGAPTATALTVNMPSGFTIDTAKLNSTGANHILPNMVANTICAGAGYALVGDLNSSTSLRLIAMGAAGTYVTSPAVVSNTVPATYANGDSVDINFTVPVVGWS